MAAAYTRLRPHVTGAGYGEAGSAFAALQQARRFGEASSAFTALRRGRRLLAWLVMFHLTCCGWLIFRASSLPKLRELIRSLFFGFAPSTADVSGLLVPLLLYVTPLLIVHLIEAQADDLLAVPRLRVGLRYSIYVATLYLIFLFGNFGGSDFIYFQF